ncbi:HDOD domain-containing protein [Massilia sp. H-1]|nr:HDOD domain-containing protein [Massilia sp. H-1]
MASEPTLPNAADTRKVRASLLSKVCGDEEMFALGSSVAQVVQMASSDDQGTHDLAYYVLSDAALTQRILRLSNTAQYRTASGTNVTTISRAISLLGFDNVKTSALAMLLVDALSSSAHAQSVRVELQAALCASLVGRELARHSFYQGAEEASIGALFKNLGPLLVASHEHERYREINALIASGKHTVGQASQMILGCSYDTLSEAVMREWEIPDVIVRSLAPLPSGTLKASASRAEWMRQVASFSIDVARLLARSTDPKSSNEARELQLRYGAALNLDSEAMAALFDTVNGEMTTLLQSMNMEPAGPGRRTGGDGRAAQCPAAGHHGRRGSDRRAPSERQAVQCARLAAGRRAGRDADARRLSKSRVNDVILAVLEILYRSMGFRFATVCLKDPRSGQYRARLAFGDDHAATQAGFVFPVEAARDLFHLAMENDADLMIADATQPKIRDLLLRPGTGPCCRTRSFIVLPLIVGKVQLGLFYADRTERAPEGVPPDETALIKALKGQVLVALTP